MNTTARLTTLMAMATTAFWMTGCVAVTCVEVPAIRGRVVDAQGQPVGNATVRMVRESDHHEVAAIPSQPDGTFHRAEQSHFALQFAGADRIATKFSVTATLGERQSPPTRVCDDIRFCYPWPLQPPTGENVGDLQVP